MNYPAQDIYNKMTNIQEEMLSVIFESYSLNGDEQSLLYDYKKVIFSSFYPNVVLLIGLLKRDFYIDKGDKVFRTTIRVLII